MSYLHCIKDIHDLDANVFALWDVCSFHLSFHCPGPQTTGPGQPSLLMAGNASGEAGLALCGNLQPPLTQAP